MRLLCPAKINLHLRVGPPRADGFHPLMSWFCTVSLFDTLTLDIEPLARDAQARQPMTLSTDMRVLPTDERNLVVRVAKEFADTPRQDGKPSDRREGVSAFLAKRIPTGAGLGGGSSDAARALLGLNSLWGIGWSTQRLSEFSARFGSDLPFFFHGPSSICTGRGEVVRPIAAPKARWAVLVLPEIHMPTPAVYRRFDEMRIGRQETLEQDVDWTRWASLSARELISLLVNDLEAPAYSLSPALSQIHDDLERMLGQIVRMSGSGSSLFTLYDERDAAESAAKKIGTELKMRALAVELAPHVLDDLKL